MPPDNNSPDAIEEANIANMLAKLKAGGILAPRDLQTLQEYQAKLAAQETQKERAADGPQVADTLKAAAGMTGFSEDELSRAKAGGCPAFRGGRVYIPDLVEWMQENRDTLPTGNKEIDAVSLDLAREKLRKARFANDVEEGKFIRREDIAGKILAIALDLKAIARKKLEEEFPDRQTMRSREEILAVNRQLVDELCDAYQEGTKKWSQT